MIAVFKTPQINANDEQVAVVFWHVADGALVTKGDELVDLETSKATVTLEAEHDGYIRQLAGKGTVIDVGAPLCHIADTAAELVEDEVAAPTPPAPAPSEAPAPRAPALQASAPTPPAADMPTRSDTATRFSKGALELIASLGLDRAAFEGRGLVTARAVQAERDPPPLTARAAVAVPSAPLPAAVRREPILPSKRAEIEALGTGEAGGINSTLSVFFDSAAIRERLAREGAFDGNFQPLILYEVSRLLLRYPQFTAFFADDHVQYLDRVDLGLALDMGKGLKVVTLRDAATLTPQDLFERTIDFGLRYADNRLAGADLVGSTFTVTDLSSFDVLQFRPLINGNQSAILGIGADSAQPGHPTTLNLTFDHRVSNGREAAQFLQELRDRLLSYAPAGRARTKAPGNVAEVPEGPVHCARCGIGQAQYQDEIGADAYMFAIFSGEGKVEAVCHRCSGGFF